LTDLTGLTGLAISRNWFSLTETVGIFNQLINPINQSTNQPINQSTNQPINQTANPINQLVWLFSRHF
jgi:hypothetical protein